MRPDPYLSSLLWGLMRDDDDASVSLTVHSGGMLIAGEAVSVTAWHARLLRDVERRADDGKAEAFRTFHAELISATSAPSGMPDAEAFLYGNYVHFVDAKVAGPGGLVKSTHLRVDLSQVSAWMIGG